MEYNNRSKMSEQDKEKEREVNKRAFDNFFPKWTPNTGAFPDRWKEEAEDEARAHQIAGIEYNGEHCPKCGRERVEICTDGKRRCEKCDWCVEDQEYQPRGYR